MARQLRQHPYLGALLCCWAVAYVILPVAPKSTATGAHAAHCLDALAAGSVIWLGIAAVIYVVRHARGA